MKKLWILIVFGAMFSSNTVWAQTSGCAIAHFTFKDTSVYDGASIQTFDVHTGKFNVDGYSDLVFDFGKAPDTVGPTILINTTPAPGGIIDFSNQYIHIGGHSSSSTPNAFMSVNSAPMSYDSLSDIVDMWGDSIYFWKNMSTPGNVKFKMTCVLSTIPGLTPPPHAAEAITPFFLVILMAMG